MKRHCSKLLKYFIFTSIKERAYPKVLLCLIIKQEQILIVTFGIV